MILLYSERLKRLRDVLLIKMFSFRFAERLCGSRESRGRWKDIAAKIKVLYDPILDYHPQYEGYEPGTEIKQADTVLAGYPLMFPMKRSTRENDLKLYGNATRSSGPAMTFSIYAINYLDVNDEPKANNMLRKSFEPHVRRPFNVWSEVVENEDGATNFITGAGGFLQTIFNGFLGIRLNLNSLEIRNPRLPETCERICINGFSYLKSKFQLKVTKTATFLTFVTLNDELRMKLDDEEIVLIDENVSCE